jgi:acetolactate synthase regulatory subunit
MMYEVKILWNKNVYETMLPVVRATFRQRGSKAENMNGRSKVSGSQRADVRLAVDQAGEMYVYSKSDGMIRRIVAAAP